MNRAGASQYVSAWGGTGLQQVVRKWGDALPRPLRREYITHKTHIIVPT
jgi:hypothetical protein